jgi:hypothetical protein
MSRLRGPFLYDRYFFMTVKLLPRRAILQDQDFKLLASSLAAAEARLCGHGLGVPAGSLARHHLPALSAEHLARAQSREGKLDDLHQLDPRDRGRSLAGPVFRIGRSEL